MLISKDSIMTKKKVIIYIELRIKIHLMNTNVMMNLNIDLRELLSSSNSCNKIIKIIK